MKNSSGSVVFSFPAGLQPLSGTGLKHSLLHPGMAEPKAEKDILPYLFSVGSNNIAIFRLQISSYKSSTQQEIPAAQNDLCHSRAFLDEMQLHLHI